MEPRRCQVHGLVLPPDGKCLICARGREHAPSAAAPKASTATYLGLLVGVLIVGTLVLGGLHFMTKDKGTTVTNLDPMAPRDVAQASEPEVQQPAPPPPPARPRPLRSSFDDEAGTRRPGGDGASDDELEAAMRGVKITMYSAPWCDVCKAARRWLQDEGYRFTDLDVEASETDSILHKSLNPRGSVPTFDVEGAVLVGFDPRRMLETIKSKAQAKLE